MANEGLTIHTLPLGPWDNFIYLLADEATKTCAVVDPAWHAPSILQEAERLDLQITHILCTHSHFDHVNRVEKLLEMSASGDKEQQQVLETYRMFANSKGWMRRMEADIASGLSAEAAVEKEQSLARARMALLAAVRQVLRSALSVLGVSAPQSMTRDVEEAVDVPAA